MTADMLNLASRAVACKGWRWMPGMMIHTGFRCVWVDDETFRAFDQNGNEMYGSTDCLLPDLTDPATLGCLLALVREAYGERRTGVRWWEPEGCAYVEHPLLEWRRPDELFPTEAEALVAALEAAP